MTALLWSIWGGVLCAQVLPSAGHYFSVHPRAGFYRGSVRVSIDAPAGALVYYTTNGDVPTPRKKRYRHPFKLSKTTVVRVLTVFPDKKRRYRALTYFIDEPPSTIPVLSIAVPPAILFDARKGLYVDGPEISYSNVFHNGANYWSRREVPVHFEFFETDSTEVFNSLVGMRIFGGVSRTFPQKSLAIVMRDKYGAKWLRHKVFGPGGLSKFKYLVLRNSGSDWGRSHLRDAFMTSLASGLNVAKQDYRPAHVYINGKYWGIYNIREKVNRTFIAQHFDVNKNNIDLLEHRYTVRAGTATAYKRLLRFVQRHDLSKPANFKKVEAMMDLDNFMDHQVAEIYFNNLDAGGNIKYWRERKPGARWRWILYDTDWGFGLRSRKDYRHNTLKDFTTPSGKEWPLPDWSTLLLRKLLTNKQFKQRFITRMMDRLNSDFRPERAVTLLDSLVAQLEPEMPRHLKRWHIKPKRWQYELKKMYTFARKRPRYVRYHLKKQFGLGNTSVVRLQTTSGGKIILNEALTIRRPFAGRYFEEIPIMVRAVPDLGYKFVGWKGINSRSPRLRLMPGKISAPLIAVFEPYHHPLTGQLVINEISSNNYESGDWVEVFNTSDHPVSLKGLYLQDRRHEFALPAVDVPSRGFAVICEDTMNFRRFHPDIKVQVIGNMPFGLHKRSELVRIVSDDNGVVDEVSYDVEPRDEFVTMSLLMPDLDNNRPENWEILSGNGTPGQANPYYALSTIRATRRFYIKMGLMAGTLLVMILVLYFKHHGNLPPILMRYYRRIATKWHHWRQ